MNNSCIMQLKLEILKKKHTGQQLWYAARIGNIEGKIYACNTDQPYLMLPNFHRISHSLILPLVIGKQF